MRKQILMLRIYLLYRIIVSVPTISYWRAVGIAQHYNDNYPEGGGVNSSSGNASAPNDILKQKVALLRSSCTETEPVAF